MDGVIVSVRCFALFYRVCALRVSLVYGRFCWRSFSRSEGRFRDAV